MEAKPLSARPSLVQYKKQAKELVEEFREAQARLAGDSGRKRVAGRRAEVVQRVREQHPRFAKLEEQGLRGAKFALADAQLVLAREHGFASWAKFAKEVERRAAEKFAEEVREPVAGFLVAASVAREWHASGTLERAEALLRAHPGVAKANIYTAAVLGEVRGVKSWLGRDPGKATEKGGPYGWDALTYLCFSRYLRLQSKRNAGSQDGAQYAAPLQRRGAATDGFVEVARALLEAGADPNTGWRGEGHKPRPTWESAIYGAAGLAQNAELTRLLLQRGADPNDEETAYHVAETYDNTVMKILVESGKLNVDGVTTILVRKADWHDFEGMKWLLEHGADPNRGTRWGRTAFHQAVLRDNRIEMLEVLLKHGADPMALMEHPNPHAPATGRPTTVVSIAVLRGRGDLLELMEKRGVQFELRGVERLLGACARGDAGAVRAIQEEEPELVRQLSATGGTVLAGFAGGGNTEGVRQLLELGVDVNAVFEEGDAYFDVTQRSTALHVAAWRAWPRTVKLLLERGAAVNARDGKERTPLMLAVKACVDSYWTARRTPESVQALLEAGATVEGVEFPSGYADVDELLKKHGAKIRVP